MILRHVDVRNPRFEISQLQIFNFFPVDDFEKWSFGQVVVMPSGMSLRAYYWELMKTYLYINLFRNRSTDMIRKYGMKSLIRIGIGTMRLSSKREILMYLGRRVDNVDAWLRVRELYASVIRRNGKGVWTTGEELDALDRSRHPRPPQLGR